MSQLTTIEDHVQSKRPETILRRPRRALDCIFSPRSVAVIGATETDGSVGRTVMTNLLRSPFGGPVYPVNPKRRSVLGVSCYSNLTDIPEKIDLAVVVTPAAAVPGVIDRCVDAKVGAAVIISAGFREMGAEGAAMEKTILEKARLGHLRLIGPNCLGVMSPLHGLNATFAAGMAKAGKVAFLSQSGALCTGVLDWSLRENVGFSAFVSTGSMLDVNWGDLIDYFGDDPTTQSILIYMESIGDVQSFMSAAREVALTKPIIVIKTGRTDAAAKAAASHTGALTGSDEVLDAAFRRAGVLRVERISDLFYMADVLAKTPRPAGKRLAIVTNAGGPGVLATDALVSGGGELAILSDETISELNQILPPHWSRGNPIDLLGDGGAERYEKVLQTVSRDPGNDALLVILTPQDMTDATATADALHRCASSFDKPVLASWMGAESVAAGKNILNRAGIPTFDFPDSAARAFNYMWQSAANLKLLYQTPALGDGMEEFPSAVEIAGGIINVARLKGRTILTEAETKKILLAYGIPVTHTHVATTARQATEAAKEIGYPVVLKLLSHTITHKTDVGGVQLNLMDEAAVLRAFKTIRQNVLSYAKETDFEGVTIQPMVHHDGYELILGSATDAQFGPVILFGLGGQLVEVFKDRALGLPPLNDVLARRMMEQTRIYTALKGVRGRQATNLAELERVIVRFSQLVLDHPRIKEIEINPFVAGPGGMIGLDARALLHDVTTAPDQLAKPAIRPYPSQYISSVQQRDGEAVTIRPIRPEDEPLMIQFHKGLSEESIRSRYFCLMSLGQRISHERLMRVCLSDYSRQIALVTEKFNAERNCQEITGVARLCRTNGSSEAEFAVLIGDRWQHHGLGTLMLLTLLRVAKDEKIKRITGEILAENSQMLRMCKRVGFSIQPSFGDILRAEIQL